MIIKLVFCFGFLICFLYKTKRSLHMLQQNLYNENNRYLKWLFKNFSQFLSVDLINIIISIAGLFILYNFPIVTNIFVFISTLLLVYAGLKYKKKILTDQNKKPLVITARIKRLLVTVCILYFIPLILYVSGYFVAKISWLLLLILNLLICFNPLIVFLANIINFPAERMVYHFYKRKAKKKLAMMNNLQVIGITGSYGKTSSKNILADILNIKYNALPTPKNLNTYYGLIMTVNNYMDKFTDIFIAEMGAYVRGEIKGLCQLVKPKYGILTRIGTAHLETFGSEENIIKAKFELIESLPSDGFGILNGDDPKQVSYHLKNNVKTIWIGIYNQDVDFLATDIKYSNQGTTFKILFKQTGKEQEFQTKLLGEHNVYNILSAVACGYMLGISIEDLVKAVKTVRPIEHRLELKKIGNFYQIDDAYNSNPIGAEAACKILGMMDGLKVVVTPGMIELGPMEYELNKKFGEQIAKVADYAILIGKKRTKPIYEGLLAGNFDKEKIIILNDVRQSYTFISKLACDELVYALYENDLPDTYNE